MKDKEAQKKCLRKQKETWTKLARECIDNANYIGVKTKKYEKLIKDNPEKVCDELLLKMPFAH